MKTFPHHFHLNGEKDVRECPEIFVNDVLEEIRNFIKSKGNL